FVPAVDSVGVPLERRQNCRVAWHDRRAGGMSDDPTRRTETPADNPMIPPPPGEPTPGSDQPGTDIPPADPGAPEAPSDSAESHPQEEWQPSAVEEATQGEVTGHKDVQPVTLDPDQKSVVLNQRATMGEQA